MIPEIKTPIKGKFVGFELRTDPLQNLVQVTIIRAIKSAIGEFDSGVKEPEKDEIQKNAISYIYSDTFDDDCEFIGWNADMWRDKINSYICDNFEPEG
jgi:hypothetical protein